MKPMSYTTELEFIAIVDKVKENPASKYDSNIKISTLVFCSTNLQVYYETSKAKMTPLLIE